MKILKVLGLLGVCTATAFAQTDQPGVFHETQTGFTMRYPVEFVLRDPQKAMDEGHIAVFGSMTKEAKVHELTLRCMKPALVSELPTSSAPVPPADVNKATLVLFELIPTKECKKDFKYKDEESLAGGIAQWAIELPGVSPLSPPLWFDFGRQKLHISFGAMGRYNTSPDQPRALIATAGMLYHGHIFGWIMSSNHLQTFNELTKSSIELDDGKIYSLVPFNLDDQLKLPINMVK